MTSRILGVLRLIAFAIVASVCIAVYIALSPIHRFSLKSASGLRRVFIGIMMVVLNVRIKIYGTMPPRNFQGIVMANHRSYFDPIAILHFIDAVTVAKAEVSKWPIIGLGTKLAGVIWVKREEKDSRKAARNEIAQYVQNGNSVLIFPEGTSSSSPQLLEVRNAVFQIAALNRISILPVAIEYEIADDAWVGDDTFIRHYVQCFGKWQTVLAMYFLPPTQQTDTEKLKSEVVNSINSSITVLRKDLAGGSEFASVPSPSHN